MAGAPADRLITGVTYDATHVSPMSRLKTLAPPAGVEPATNRVETGRSIH